MKTKTIIIIIIAAIAVFAAVFNDYMVDDRTEKIDRIGRYFFFDNTKIINKENNQW